MIDLQDYCAPITEIADELDINVTSFDYNYHRGMHNISVEINEEGYFMSACMYNDLQVEITKLQAELTKLRKIQDLLSVLKGEL